MVSRLPRAFFAALIIVAVASPLTAQTQGERVYASASDSIFLLRVADASGQTAGEATGFLVGPNQILTNAHVADAGAINIRVGPIEVGCDVKRVDRLNDLALCEIAAKSSAIPLKFAASEPKPGATVFAIGNPRGLEKTISQGLFTGFREVEGQRVAQISAAISPGSSGGPVFNTDGEVVGVAVSSLTNGQTLNFAVPLAVVRDFLSGKTSSPASLESIKALISKRDDLDYDSPQWKEVDGQVAATLKNLIESTNDLSVLSAVPEVLGFGHYDIQADAARKSIQLSKPASRELYTRLAEALYLSSDTNVPQTALDEAEKAALRAVALGRGLIADDLRLLGDIQDQQGRRAEAYATYLKSASVAKPATDEAATAYMRLFQSSDTAGKTAEADTWFKKISATPKRPTFFEFSAYAQFLDRERRYKDAGAAWMAAYDQVPGYRFMCESAESYFFAGEYDAALPGGRKCLELAAKANAKNDIARAHRILSAVLVDRAVYEEAESHAREGIALSPEDSNLHYYLGRALISERRFTEALESAKTAIRLSDGKFGYMHFSLGDAYFELKQWPEAVQAYTKAAEINPNDSAAAYNVAVSNYNARYYADALRWYREALRRNPNNPDREEINRMIAQLSSR